MWFAFEHRIFTQYRGKKWLWDVLSETKSRVLGDVSFSERRSTISIAHSRQDIQLMSVRSDDGWVLPQVQSRIPVTAGHLPIEAVGIRNGGASTAAGSYNNSADYAETIPWTDSPEATDLSLLRPHYPTPRQDTMSSNSSKFRDGGTVPTGDFRRATTNAHLRSLQSAHTFTEHQSMVRYLQFSPNGRLLASTRCVRGKFLTVEV